MRNNVADQFRLIHSLGELVFVVIAGDGANAFQVWIDRRINARLDQVAALDQLGDLWALDDGLENAAEPAAVAATRRGGQAKQFRVRIGVDNFSVGARRAMLRLIDHKQISRRQVDRTGADRASVQCLN